MRERVPIVPLLDYLVIIEHKDEDPCTTYLSVTLNRHKLNIQVLMGSVKTTQDMMDRMITCLISFL